MRDTPEIKEVLEYMDGIGYSSQIIGTACRELSIQVDELLPKTLDEFDYPNQNLTKMWQKHYEARRKAKLIIIGKYLLENRLFLPKKLKKNELKRSFSSSNAQRTNLITTSKIRNKDDSFDQIELIKKHLMKKINVENNLKKIKENEEKRRKSFETKLIEKSSRSERKHSIEKIRLFEKHQKRIKDILYKKYKDIDEHERNALISMSINKEETRSQTSLSHTPQKKVSKVICKQNNEINIEKKLFDIYTKLSRSAERAKKILLEKANSGSILLKQIKKVKLAKQELEQETEKRRFLTISKMHKGIVESSKRRQEHLLNEKNRIARNNKTQIQRITKEQLKIEQDQAQKHKTIMEKAAYKEKVQKELKDILEKNSQISSLKNHQRKKDQQNNLKRLKKQFESIKVTLIEKFKELEQDSKLRAEVDIPQLKAKIEAELRNNLYGKS